MTTPPVVLCIGGSDSGGCYGIGADLGLLASLGAHGCCALTVVTAQNTLGLRATHQIPLELIADQIEMVLEDFAVAAVKTGMLARVEVVELVAALAGQSRLPNLVVDPVLVNRHGMELFGEEVTHAYRQLLLPRARLATPNTIEAALLADAKHDPVHGPWPCPTVITGGRVPDNVRCVDVLVEGSQRHELVADRVATTNNAGSGDAFSAASAWGLARGLSLLEAVTDAKEIVRGGLVAGASWQLGHGPGPLGRR